MYKLQPHSAFPRACTGCCFRHDFHERIPRTFSQLGHEVSKPLFHIRCTFDMSTRMRVSPPGSSAKALRSPLGQRWPVKRTKSNRREAKRTLDFSKSMHRTQLIGDMFVSVMIGSISNANAHFHRYNTLLRLWTWFIFLMIGYFVLGCINQFAQTEAARRAEQKV